MKRAPRSETCGPSTSSSHQRTPPPGSCTATPTAKGVEIYAFATTSADIADVSSASASSRVVFARS
jgi:hypothetical protein